MKLLALAITCAAVSLAGCVPYPVYKTLQPAAKATVLDGAGKPMAGAEVTLIANASPYGFEKSRVIRRTDSDGVAQFAAVRELRIESLMIHGVTVFVWSWCVRKPGYLTYRTAHGDARKFERNLVVRLRPGRSAPCSE